jgi:hypothetical protein
MAWTKKPEARRWADAARAAWLSPMTRGMMGEPMGSAGRERAVRIWATDVLRERRSISPWSDVVMARDAETAAATGGGMAVVKRKVRAWLMR